MKVYSVNYAGDPFSQTVKRVFPVHNHIWILRTLLKQFKVNWYTSMFFIPLLQREITSVTVCLLPWRMLSFENGSVFKEKNLSSQEQILSFKS